MSHDAIAAANPGLADFHRNPPLDLVHSMVRRVLRRVPETVQYDDLYSAGLTALVEASQRFDAARGVDFRAFAKLRVYGAMLDELRSLDTVSRMRRRAIRNGVDNPDAPPAPRPSDISAADTIADPSPSAEEQLDRHQARQRVRNAEAALPPRLRLVLKLRIENEWTLREIGDHLGVSEARACQLVGAALRRLRASTVGAADGSGDGGRAKAAA